MLGWYHHYVKEQSKAMRCVEENEGREATEESGIVLTEVGQRKKREERGL